jgi:long-chain fatty acid transport protein
MPRLPHPLVTATAAAALLLAAGGVRAAGFASAEFGGEHGNVVATNPTALYYNPAGIAFASGTSLYVDGVLAWRRGSWDHAAVATEAPDPPGAEGANAGRARFSNLLAAPMLGATTHLGGPGGVALGAAFYVPFGGRIAWDRNPRFASDPTYPLAAGGVQRWTITEGSLAFLYFTVGAAYRFGRASVGLTGNLVRSSVRQTQAKNFSGLGDPDSANEGRDTVDVSGTEGSFGAGAMVEAVPDRLWLGISYQAQPGLGVMRLHGTLALQVSAADAPTTQPVTLTQALPEIVRLGARLRAGRAVELRLHGDYTRWSRLQTQCIALAGHPCAVFPSGADATGEGGIFQNIRRQWKDTFAVRAGASAWVRPAVELFAGLGLETAAAPDATLDTALPDAASVRTALGARIELARRTFVSAELASLWYLGRDNTGQSRLADAEPPTRRADAGGRYSLWLGVANLSVEKQF